ncbi:hypothetical protein IAI10_16750 [Clostridium sp. 19966]|uniref:hypothetical protein n=1 Tax=Clostridium sp. 19966 TaxID=2768166 RepID=UPI0028DF7915|nr:hypothetical protein [Clostridium sp. 19966]MDT8718318.1 hypothetical protein [Clostridium sp. 19966]
MKKISNFKIYIVSSIIGGLILNVLNVELNLSMAQTILGSSAYTVILICLGVYLITIRKHKW